MNDKIDDGGPAFPQPVTKDAFGNLIHTELAGLSMRDYFAAKALPLTWAIEQERPTGPYIEHMEPTYAGAATRAYFMADAMLAARKVNVEKVKEEVK